MDPTAVLTGARERMSLRTVFGEPITHDGVAVIPVARVSGGAGGGSGSRTGTEEGTGGGFGVRAAPVGVFVVRNGDVTWRPAVDINKIILGGQIVAVVALLTIRSIVRANRGRRAAAERAG